jgi:hypothetical protein
MAMPRARPLPILPLHAAGKDKCTTLRRRTPTATGCYSARTAADAGGTAGWSSTTLGARSPGTIADAELAEKFERSARGVCIRWFSPFGFPFSNPKAERLLSYPLSEVFEASDEVERLPRKERARALNFAAGQA